MEEKEILREKLLVSETRYRRLFETAKDGIIIIDPLTEKIVDVNPYFLEMVGYSFDNVVGKKLFEIGALKDAEAGKKIYAELAGKGYARYENLPLKTKDGREIQVEFVSNLYPINSVKMIQCNVRNITDRKIAESIAKKYLEGLEKLNGFMVNREVKMVDLKKEIEYLKKEITDLTAKLLVK